MDEHDVTSGEARLPAGTFTAWLAQLRRAVDDAGATDVPCGTCTACCTSAQFVHIEPDERETLARIPSELRFPAPGLPDGHVLLGYDEHGHCPMLVDGTCSIYDDRPRTCRTYDCRVFAAAGVWPEGEEKRAIAQRVGQWRFDHPAQVDEVRHDAVRAASDYLRRHPDVIPGATATATRLALTAADVHEAFVDDHGEVRAAEPDAADVREALAARSARWRSGGSSRS